MTKYITTPVLGIGAMAIKTAADFEQGLSNVKAVTGATAEQMEQYKQLALEMGKQTSFSALEATKGIEELAKAGLTTQQILNGGLKGALDLAVAGELQLGEAAEIASTALNAFNRDNLTMIQAADILAGAANASATSVQELKFGLAQVSAVASGLGINFKDVNTTLAVFASNGLKGSDAGTSLKTMLSRLQPDTKEATELMKKYGLMTANGVNAFIDANGQFKSMSEIAEILHKRLGHLTDAQRQFVLMQIFGSDAVRGATILTQKGAAGFKEMTEAMEKTTAAQVAAERLKNVKGQLTLLKSNLETTGISIGETFLPHINKLVVFLGKITDKFNNLSKPQKDLIVNFLIFAAILGPVVFIIGSLTTSIGGLIGSINKFAKAVKTVGLLSAIATPGVIVIGVILAIATAAFLIIKYWQPIKSFFVNLWNGIKEGALAIWEVIVGAFKGYVNIWISLINFVIEKINSINVTAPDWIPGIGGKTFGFNIPLIPKLAAGTNYWSGGLVQVSERGGEIIDLPKGSRVYPHDESVRLARKQGQAEGGINITIPKLADTLIIREEADITKIAKAFATEIKKSNINIAMGGVT